MRWPEGIRVGHTDPKSGRKVVTLNACETELSPDEARTVDEIVRRIKLPPDWKVVNCKRLSQARSEGKRPRKGR